MNYHAYNTAHAIADRVASTMRDLRQAERDVAQHCGLAFDGGDATEIYRNALDHLGISRSETAGLQISALKMLLKSRPAPGTPAWRRAPSMAQDSKAPSVLDSILAGAKAPRDITHRNDHR